MAIKAGGGKPAVPQFTVIPRRLISTSPADMVTVEPFEGRCFPLVVSPSAKVIDLVGWAESDRERIRAMLSRYGALLFRGFDVRTVAEFERFIVVTSGQPLPYLERSSPRTPRSGYIYSSTEYPAEQSIFLHSENSYQKTWPLKIFFYCEAAPEQGGETPIADTRTILQRISPGVRERFDREGVMYARNFGIGVGFSWQTVFQTEDRQAVEKYCSDHDIQYFWEGANGLRTTQVRKAIQIHPVTGESVWFNHAVFFHVSTLDPVTRRVFETSLSEAELPNNTYYGDGSAIEPEVLDHLRAAYNYEAVRFRWHQGDILMLDNMLAAHGRFPYSGGRKILVGMSEPHSA